MSVIGDILRQKSQQATQAATGAAASPVAPAVPGAAVAPAAQVATATQETTPKSVVNDAVNAMNTAAKTPAAAAVSAGAATAVPGAAAAPAVPVAQAQPQQLSYVDMLNKFYTPETAEQKAKRERKEKWDKTAAAIGDGISALANLYYTTKGAPNSYDGKNSMSERTRQLYDKINNERKENERWYLNHYMNASKMDEEAKRYKEQLDYRDKQDAIKKEQYEEGIAHRNAREAVQDANTKWQQEFQQSNADWQHANTEKQQANANKLAWADHNLRVKNYERQLEKENEPVQFAIGNGRTATVKKQNIHTHNVSYVYNKLPKEIRDQYAQEPSYDKDGKPVETYKKDANGKYVKDANGNYIKEPVMKARKLNDSDKMAIIGEHIANNPDVQNAWKEIGGEITTSTQQTGGGKNHSHRVGGNKSGTTDV